jgi:proline iminopeptidase
MQRVWDSLGEYDIRDKLREIRVPTLIIHGRYDPIPLKYAEEIHHLIPSSDLTVFERSGHVVFVEEMEKFGRVVGAFL